MSIPYFLFFKIHEFTYELLIKTQSFTRITASASNFKFQHNKTTTNAVPNFLIYKFSSTLLIIVFRVEIGSESKPEKIHYKKFLTENIAELYHLK